MSVLAPEASAPETSAAPAFRLPEDLSPATVESVVSSLAAAYVQTGRDDGGVLLDCVEPTVVAVSLAGQLVHDGAVNRVVVLSSVERIGFWTDEIERYTGIPGLCHYGTGREQRLRTRNPIVLASTHDTLRPELTVHVPRAGSRGKSWQPGPLAHTLELLTTSTLWIFDQVGKLDHRGTETYGGYEYFFRAARAHAHQRLLGLYPPSLDEHRRAFDLGRIFFPSRMPSVAEFENQYCLPMFSGEPVLRPQRRADFHRLFSGAVIH